jgi:hypothetical protein
MHERTSQFVTKEIRVMCNSAALAPARQIDESATRLVERLIALTGIQPTNHVIVAGRSTLPIFLALCRWNFLRACCRTVSSPHVTEEPADALWLLNTKSEAELLALASNLARDLRPNGTVVIALSSLTSTGFPFRLRHLLLENGFAAAHQRAVSIRGDVYLIARRDTRVRAKAAA